MDYIYTHIYGVASLSSTKFGTKVLRGEALKRCKNHKGFLNGTLSTQYDFSNLDFQTVARQQCHNLRK